MAMPSKEELKSIKDDLQSWHRPDALMKIHDDARNKLGPGVHGLAVLFRKSQCNPLLEAHAAAKFAKLRGAELLRLSPKDPPDFEVEYSCGRTEGYELTEAIEPGRRRGDEYKYEAQECENPDGITVVDFPEDEWAKVGDVLPILTERTAAKVDGLRKRRKRGLTTSYGLAIYLNFRFFPAEPDEVAAVTEAFHPGTEIGKDEFPSVWVLWDGKAYEVWNNGSQSTTVLA